MKHTAFFPKNRPIHAIRVGLLMLAFGLWAVVGLFAQRDSRLPRTPVAVDTLAPLAAADSIAPVKPTLRVAEGSFDAPVQYGAADSMYVDVAQKRVHLYGEAFVTYGSIDLRAGYILLDYGINEVSAQEIADTSGALTGLPQFKEGDNTFNAKRLRYNFRSKKGIIYEARTQQEDLYVLGEKAKFTGREIVLNDSTKVTENTIYNQDAIITSCDHEHPHFGIRTKKLKVIPDKLVIAGLSNLEIEGVPTPLFLPFGFYPITKTKKSGLLLPRDFQFNSQTQGFGIQDIGYYIPISEHADFTAKFDYFVRGSYKAGGLLNYKKRYKMDGNLYFEFNDRKSENQFAEKISQKSTTFRWSHNQDRAAHPTRKFGGSIDIQSNRNDNIVYNNFDRVYQNTKSSNMTYSQTFPGKPYSLNASFRHSQNNQTREMRISFPDVNFQMQRIYPLKRKEPIGAERWYEKISLNYSSSARNQMSNVDSLIFDKSTLEKAQFGIQHKASSDIQLKLFKYINVAPNISYEENWYGRRTEYNFIDEVIPGYDTVLVDGLPILVLDSTKTQWGRLDTNLVWGFLPYRNYNAGISANTNLYMTKRFKNGWLRGVRHVMTPSVNVGFGPDFSENTNFFRNYNFSNRPSLADSQKLYSIFDGAIFGQPTQSKRDISLNYSLRNVLEMKYFSRKDTTGTGLVKKTIFSNLTFSGSYKLITEDSLKWTTINTGGSFQLIKNITSANWNLTLDPYIQDSITFRRVPRYALKEQGKLFRMPVFSTSISTRMTFRQLRGFVDKSLAESPSSNSAGGATTFFSILDGMSLNHYIQLSRELRPNGTDTFLLRSHTIGVNGNIPLTSRWSLQVSNISYDFKGKSLVYPDFGLQRDLHCWTMDFSWQPVRGTFNFSIFVKSGTLNFLKVPYRRNNLDPPLSF